MEAAVVDFLRRVQAHRWTARRMLMVEEMMENGREIDGLEYGRVTFNLAPTAVTTELNFVRPKKRVAGEPGRV
jgi:hypothetical protein